MNIYYPGNKFPSLSVTGTHCALRCKHCNAKYLQHMIPVETPEKLRSFVEENKERINGFLLSGGSTPDGKVPLRKFAKVVRWTVENTNLLVNIHTGIIDEGDMEYLQYMKPHHVSFDFIGASEVIERVLGNGKNEKNYIQALEILDSSSLNYSPHIIIGLDFGKIWWEYGSIDIISKLKRFSNLVLIALIPTRGTPMESVKVDEEEIMEVIKYASSRIPPEKLVLGCMRPRKFVNMERLAVELGFRGIVMPSLKTMRYIREKSLELKKLETCCVF